MKYRIELEEYQLKLISDCLEMVSRIYCGQLDTITIFPLNDELYDNNKPCTLRDFSNKSSKVNGKLNEIKEIIWGEMSGHHGIGYNKEADHLYDMYKQILYKIEQVKKDNSKVSNTRYQSNVHTSKPTQHTHHPPIKVNPLTKDIIRDDSIDEILSSK